VPRDEHEVVTLSEVLLAVWNAVRAEVAPIPDLHLRAEADPVTQGQRSSAQVGVLVVYEAIIVEAPEHLDEMSVHQHVIAVEHIYVPRGRRLVAAVGVAISRVDEHWGFRGVGHISRGIGVVPGKLHAANNADVLLGELIQTGRWRDLLAVEPPQAPDLRELFVEWGLCGQM